MKKEILFLAAVCGLMVGCNGGGSVVDKRDMRDSAVVVGDVEAKWDTIDWDEREMPIYVCVEREYGGKFVPSVRGDSARMVGVAGGYKTFVSREGKLEMKYEKYEAGAGAK